jgi:hypothetical protein
MFEYFVESAGFKTLLDIFILVILSVYDKLITYKIDKGRNQQHGLREHEHRTFRTGVGQKVFRRFHIVHNKGKH